MEQSAHDGGIKQIYFKARYSRDQYNTNAGCVYTLHTIQSMCKESNRFNFHV